ncbi:hypothetical protein STEG23_030906 [Scotinomys teguina]
MDRLGCGRRKAAWKPWRKRYTGEVQGTGQTKVLEPSPPSPPPAPAAPAVEAAKALSEQLYQNQQTQNNKRTIILDSTSLWRGGGKRFVCRYHIRDIVTQNSIHTLKDATLNIDVNSH